MTRSPNTCFEYLVPGTTLVTNFFLGFGQKEFIWRYPVVAISTEAGIQFFVPPTWSTILLGKRRQGGNSWKPVLTFPPDTTVQLFVPLAAVIARGRWIGDVRGYLRSIGNLRRC